MGAVPPVWGGASSVKEQLVNTLGLQAMVLLQLLHSAIVAGSSWGFTQMTVHGCVPKTLDL